jgi:diguanylate cyclase (GGDEF)-like protein
MPMRPTMADNPEVQDPIRVLIADDDEPFARLLGRVVAGAGGVEVVGAGRDADEAIALAEATQPDIAILDVRMPAGGGARAAREIGKRSPGTRLLALSGFGDEEAVLDMLAAGASAYVMKGGSAREIRDAVTAVMRGESPLSSRIAGVVVSALTERIHRQQEETGRFEAVRARVRDAVSGDGLSMAFQPIVDLASGVVHGVAALPRFDGPPRQPPGVWLREAEEVGLRAELELASVRLALEALPLLPPESFVGIGVGPVVAASPRLSDAIPVTEAGRIVLELIDHGGVGDYGVLSEALAGLRERGVRVALDDSGEGLASLQHIGELRPEFVKLDRSLTRNVDRDPTRRALAFALLSFAVQTGATVIADGIETRAELGALRGLGATYGRGYLIGRPLRLVDGPAFPVRVDLPPVPNQFRGGGAGAATAPVRRFRTFLDGMRIALDALEERMPGSVLMLGHLDYSTRVMRLIEARGPADLSLAPGRTFPLDEAPCYHMSSGRGPRLCGDIASEPVYAALPLLVEADAVSYAGAPLELTDGTRIGALSALSPRADAYDEAGLEVMRGLAAALAATLEHDHPAEPQVLADELRRYATIDWLTGVMNSCGLHEVLEHQWRRARRDRVSTYVVRVKVRDLSAVNERYGRTLGDLLLKDLASCLEASGKVSDIVGRLGGSEFGAVLVGCSREEGASYFCKALSGRLSEQLRRRELDADVVAGVAPLGDAESVQEALDRAAASPFRVV